MAHDILNETKVKRADLSLRKANISFGRHALLIMIFVGAMILAACGLYPAASATPTPIRPSETATLPVVEPTPTIELTPTLPVATATPEPVVIPDHFEFGQFMTLEQLEVSVDNFYALTEAELQGMLGVNSEKLWRYEDYPDSLPRNMDGEVLSSDGREDIGFLCALNSESLGKENHYEIQYYNAILLGIMKVDEVDEKVLFVAAFGMKDAYGQRFTAYGVIDPFKDQLIGINHYYPSAWGGDRFFRYPGPGESPIDMYGVFEELMNEYVGDVVLVNTIEFENLDLSNKEVKYREQFTGDGVLYDILMGQYLYNADLSPRDYFEKLEQMGLSSPDSVHGMMGLVSINVAKK